MAHHQLAHRHERKAQGSFRRCPGAGRRRTTPADQGQGPTTSARRRGLAHRRTQDVGREQILSRQPASEDQPAHLSNHHQGALGLRAGSPADERRTWSRPLRGTILARPSPSCAYDDDRLRLPPASPARNSKAGKKDSTGPRLSQLCPPCATPSSNFSLDYRRSDARIVENGFAASSGVNKSAKVVLGQFASGRSRPTGYLRAPTPRCRLYACARTCCRCPVLIHSRAPAAPATAVRRDAFGSLSQECRANVSPPSSKLPASTSASKPPGTSSTTPASACHCSMRTSSRPSLNRGMSLTPRRPAGATASTSLVSMLTCERSAGSN